MIGQGKIYTEKKILAKKFLSQKLFFEKRIFHIKGLLMLFHSNRLKKDIKLKKNLFKRNPCFPKVILRDSALITYYDYPTTSLRKILIKISLGFNIDMVSETVFDYLKLSQKTFPCVILSFYIGLYSREGVL